MTDVMPVEFPEIPLWLTLVKALGVFVLLVLIVLFTIWFERRVVGRMQHRIGPNVNGPFGLLQSLADGVKLALKEDIIPTAADKVVFLIAPVIAPDQAETPILRLIWLPVYAVTAGLLVFRFDKVIRAWPAWLMLAAGLYLIVRRS